MVYMIYVYDFDVNPPLYTSGGKIDIRPNGHDAISLRVPNEQVTQDRYWVIGCFTGFHTGTGLHTIKIVNKLVTELPNLHIEYCNL